MLDNTLFLSIGGILCLLLPFAVSRIYMKKITSKTSDNEVLKAYYDKNKSILSFIGYAFLGFVAIIILLRRFIPLSKEFYNLYTEINIYVTAAVVAIAPFFVFNKQYLANKIMKK